MTLGQTDYDLIAEQYKCAKQHPWRRAIEHYTLFSMLGNLAGGSVLDLACGEGFLTRPLKLHGATRVVGVDKFQAMIRLAENEEQARPLGIDYMVQDVLDLDMRGEKFGVVTAAYLLNYARTREELLRMCRQIAISLTPGGRFVGANDNPMHLAEYFGESQPYGFIKETPGKLEDGSPVVYRFLLEDGEITVTNFHFSPEVYEQAFQEAGLRNFNWQAPLLDPEVKAKSSKGYWDPFLRRPPVIFMEATR